MAKTKYKVDLGGQLAECEVNYARIMQLLPNMDQIDSCEFGISFKGSGKAKFRLQVVERCKYTTMLSFGQSQGVAGWSDAPQFDLRVYHDAQMAEVIGFHSGSDHQARRSYRNLKPAYQYPNKQMLHCDEKAQLNRFLGEWLSYCLQYGYALDTPPEAGLCEITHY